MLHGLKRLSTLHYRLAIVSTLGLALLLLAGCGASGPTDPRLCGTWEGRKGWATTIKVVFRSDGSTTMTTKESSGSGKTMRASWGVMKTGRRSIKIFISSSSRKEERIVKFIDDDHIEMKSSGGGLTRLQRVGS